MAYSGGRASTVSLLLRWMLAVVFFFHGAQMLLGWFGGAGLRGSVEYMHRMGVPLVFAYLGSCTEFVVSILLLLGLFTRPASMLLFFFMIVATYLGGHIRHGFFMNWSGRQTGEGVEFNLSLLVMILCVFVLGGGDFSLDARLRRRGR